MILSFRYRAYPLLSQLPELDRWRHELTYLWNFALEERRKAWEREQRRVSYLDQQRHLTDWRNFDREGLGRVPVAIAQATLQRLDLAFKDFFRRVNERKMGKRGKPGYPRRRRDVPSFTFTPPNDPWVPGPHATWRLKVPRLGTLPVRRHRPPPEAGRVRTVTLRREDDGWYATLAYEVPDPPPPPPGPPGAPVGIDLGVSHLATLSTGEVVDPPHFLARAEQELRRHQRRLSRRKKGSHRWEQERERVARCHGRVRRQRRHFLHEVSHDLAERFDLLAVEDLDVRALAGSMLAKPILDQGWGSLLQMLGYKAALRSGRLVKVDPRGSTQECCRCGRRADPPLSLGDRTYRCPCGLTADRDLNAACNLLDRGLTTVGRSTPEVTRGESGPLARRVGRRAYQRRQAGSGSREFDGAGTTDWGAGPPGPPTMPPSIR